MRDARHGQKDIFYAEKNKDDLQGENRAGEQQEIREQKDDAPPHGLMSFIEENQPADPEKKP
jgi:hypothetical protein